MTRTEALTLALEALGTWSSGRDMDAVELNDLIATLEAALGQPEQQCSGCGKTDPGWALYCVECIEGKIRPALEQEP